MTDTGLKLTVRLDVDTVIEITMVKVTDDRFPGDPPAALERQTPSFRDVHRALDMLNANSIEKIE